MCDVTVCDFNAECTDDGCSCMEGFEGTGVAESGVPGCVGKWITDRSLKNTILLVMGTIFIIYQSKWRIKKRFISLCRILSCRFWKFSLPFVLNTLWCSVFRYQWMPDWCSKLSWWCDLYKHTRKLSLCLQRRLWWWWCDIMCCRLVSVNTLQTQNVNLRSSFWVGYQYNIFVYQDDGLIWNL